MRFLFFSGGFLQNQARRAINPTGQSPAGPPHRVRTLRVRALRRGLARLLLLLLLACDSSPRSLCADVVCAIEGTTCDEADGTCRCGATGPACGDAEACDAELAECFTPLPEAICTGGSSYAPGTASFREVTGEWGLNGVLGVRVNVADIDGDGYADLMVRRGGQAIDDLSPDGTRRTWLLRNREGNGFDDVTVESGILASRMALGPNAGRPIEIAAFADVDNDGDLDAYLGVNTVDEEATMGETAEILLNDGTGVFALGPDSSELRSVGRVNVPAGASFTDVDRDGVVDLWIPQHNWGSSTIVFMQDRLYRGDGTGAFTEITESVGLETLNWRGADEINQGLAHTRAWGSLARDLDGDGNPELLVPSYGRSPNHLWRGEDGGTFVNASVESGYAYDANLTWQDNEFARCYCQSDPSAEGCAEVEAPRVSCSDNWRHGSDREPYRLGGNSGSTSAGDLDNDGDLDLFTGEIKHWWAGSGSDGSEALINEGGLSFARPGDAALGLEVDHLGRVAWDEGHMTQALLDFDNDGRLDVYIGASDYPGNRGNLFHQDDTLQFTNVPTTDFFEHNRSHGVVVADFDRDGDLDLIVGHSRARCDAAEPNDCYETPQVRAFENVTPPGNWIQLHLVGGEGSNAAAIGAQVLAEYGELVQRLEVDGGHGHYGSQSDTVLHIGLGTACEARITVRWPNAALTEETLILPAGHRFRIEQGQRPVVE